SRSGGCEWHSQHQPDSRWSAHYHSELLRRWGSNASARRRDDPYGTAGREPVPYFAAIRGISVGAAGSKPADYQPESDLHQPADCHSYLIWQCRLTIRSRYSAARL